MRGFGSISGRHKPPLACPYCQPNSTEMEEIRGIGTRVVTLQVQRHICNYILKMENICKSIFSLERGLYCVICNGIYL